VLQRTSGGQREKAKRNRTRMTRMQQIVTDKIGVNPSDPRYQRSIKNDPESAGPFNHF
jgi:hypothetical protein